ncbi:MAG: hypothetical protein ABI777_08670 [Betaproteobacteria bacterium]
MVFAYYDMLSPARKEIYRQSDAIATLEMPPGVDVGGRVLGIRDGLMRAHRPTVQKDAQALINALVVGFAVPDVDVRVLAARPSDVDGELHGLYEPDEEIPVARISVWMRTAQRKQVVAFKSFLRTLVHEFLHHLDYEHFKLPETFHTEGFYKRESSLTNALMSAEPEQR